MSEVLMDPFKAVRGHIPWKEVTHEQKWGASLAKTFKGRFKGYTGLMLQCICWTLYAVAIKIDLEFTTPDQSGEVPATAATTAAMNRQYNRDTRA